MSAEAERQILVARAKTGWGEIRLSVLCDDRRDAAVDAAGPSVEGGVGATGRSSGAAGPRARAARLDPLHRRGSNPSLRATRPISKTRFRP
jgi:hypothetical protein